MKPSARAQGNLEKASGARRSLISATEARSLPSLSIDEGEKAKVVANDVTEVGAGGSRGSFE